MRLLSKQEAEQRLAAGAAEAYKHEAQREEQLAALWQEMQAKAIKAASCGE